jgi:hypothetical protein
MFLPYVPCTVIVIAILGLNSLANISENEQKTAALVAK